MFKLASLATTALAVNVDKRVPPIGRFLLDEFSLAQTSQEGCDLSELRSAELQYLNAFVELKMAEHDEDDEAVEEWYGRFDRAEEYY